MRGKSVFKKLGNGYQPELHLSTNIINDLLTDLY